MRGYFSWNIRGWTLIKTTMSTIIIMSITNSIDFKNGKILPVLLKNLGVWSLKWTSNHFLIGNLCKRWQWRKLCDQLLFFFKMTFDHPGWSTDFSEMFIKLPNAWLLPENALSFLSSEVKPKQKPGFSILFDLQEFIHSRTHTAHNNISWEYLFQVSNNFLILTQ